MDHETLVEQQIRDGQALVRKFDQSKFPFVSAFWFYYPDQDAWKLVVATDEAGDPIKAYTRLSGIISSIEEQGFSLDISQVKLVKPTDPLIRALRIIRIEGISNVRFTSNLINGVYIDDALIYRNVA